MADDNNDQPSSSLTQAVKSRANLKQLLELNKEAIAAVIPAYLTPDKMLKVVMLTAMQNPDIFECTKESILKSVMISAQSGIPIGPQSGHLVPFNRKIKAKGSVPEHWIKEAIFIPDYRGLIAQAKRCEAITKAEAHLVYVDDVFEIDWGNESKPLTHKPNYLSKKRDIDHVVAAYFRAKLPDGDYQYEVMTKAELDAIKRRSKASEQGPWVTDTGQMYRKTVSKRGLNYIPNLSDNVIAAIEHDNQIEAGGESIDVVGLLTDVSSETPSETQKPTTTSEATKTKMESVASKVADAKDRAETARKAEQSLKPTEQKKPKAAERAKSTPARSETKTNGEVPPWAKEPATEPVAPQETLLESEPEKSLEEVVAEMAAPPVERVKRKNPDIHGVVFPEFIDIGGDDEAPSPSDFDECASTFQTLCEMLGQTGKAFDKTVQDFSGIDVTRINAAALKALTQVFNVAIERKRNG